MVAERTYHCIGGSVRDDVRLVAAVREDAVDPLGRADVLAQRGDVHVAEHGGVEGVAALRWGADAAWAASPW